MRLIDGDELIERWAFGMYDTDDGTIRQVVAVKAIKDMPNIAPRDWTPCDEGSPSKNDFYQTTERTRLGEIIRNVRHYGARGWQIKWGCGITVIAWQPLPAAWKEPENV